MFKTKALIILIFMLFSTQVLANDTASYDTETGALHIPKVKIEGDDFGVSYNVKMINKGDWSFGISDATIYLDSPVTLMGLSIVGGTQIAEDSSISLSALALWSDGTWSDVTQDTIWSESSSAISSVVSGLVETASVSSNRTASIKASFDHNGSSVNASHVVSVTNSFVGRAYFQLIDHDVPSGYWAPLLNTDRNGIFFDLGGISYVIQSDEFLNANTYSELANAIENELVPQGLLGLMNVSIGDPFYTYNDSGEYVQGYTIVLEAMNMEFSNLGFTRPPDISGEFNVYGRFFTEPIAMY